MKTLAEWKAGEALEPVVIGPVTRLDLIRYAGASGDFNPIHTIDEEARLAGLPGIIAHGMWTMGNLSRLFTPFLDSAFIKEYSVRFQGMVLLGDRITLQAVLENRAGRTFTFAVTAVNQSDKTVLKGHLVLEWLREPPASE